MNKKINIKIPLYNNCLICRKLIKTIPSRIKRGQDKYCSRRHFYDSRKGKNTVPWMNILGRKTWWKELGIKPPLNTGRTRFKKGNITWNTGKKAPQISLALKGRKLSLTTIEKIRVSKLGNKNRLGQKLSEESRIKISKNRKGQMMGEDNPRWKGGITALRDQVRQLSEYKNWRKRIFKRDNYKCIICDKNGYLEADHHPRMFSILLQEAIDIYGKDINKIRNYSPLWDINNGRTTCREHNRRTFCGNMYKGGIYK